MNETTEIVNESFCLFEENLPNLSFRVPWTQTALAATINRIQLLLLFLASYNFALE